MHRRVALIINTQGSRCGLCRKPVYHDVGSHCPNCSVKFGVIQVSDMRYLTKFPRLRARLPVEFRGRLQSVSATARRNSLPIPGSLIHGHRRAGQNGMAASLTSRSTSVTAEHQESTPVLARPATPVPTPAPLVPDSSV